MRRSVRLLAALSVVVAASCHTSGPAVTGLFRASAWQVQQGAFDGPVVITAVAPGTVSAPWVAVGMAAGSGGEPATACFLSADAKSWAPCSLAPVDRDGKHTRLLAVGRLRTTVVAGGVAVGALHGNPRPTLWHFAPGQPLAELPLPRELFGGERIIGFSGLATGPLGGLAVGTWDGLTDQAVAQVWRTLDGVDWERLDGIAAMTSTADELLRGAAVAVGSRRAVVVGASLRLSRLGDGEDGAVWWSDDGRRWTRADVANAGMGGRGYQELRVVAPAGDGFLAAGSDAATAAVWSSSDGSVWHRAAALPGATGKGATITSLSAAGPWRWAAGVVDGRPCFWGSRDSQHWAAEPLPPGWPSGGVQSMTMAAGAGLLLLVAQAADGPHAAVIPLPSVLSAGR